MPCRATKKTSVAGSLSGLGSSASRRGRPLLPPLCVRGSDQIVGGDEGVSERASVRAMGRGRGEGWVGCGEVVKFLFYVEVSHGL